MVDVFKYQHCSVLGTEEVPEEDVSSYGIVAGTKVGERLMEVSGMVEKPKREDAPSRQAVVGRYILTPRIFDLLESTQRGAGNEIQLTDAIARLLKEERVLSYNFKGRRFDCGSKLGYLKAQVEFALEHAEVGPEFSAYLHELIESRASDDKIVPIAQAR